MPDWTKPMKQTFSFYKVNPTDWLDYEKVDSITSGSISWDAKAETCGSISLSSTENIGECYLRVYMEVEQENKKERIPLGTFLIQTPSNSFNGTNSVYKIDGYTPLIELKENMPPFGYFISDTEDVIKKARTIIDENARAPFISPDFRQTLDAPFLASAKDTWLSFLNGVLANAEYSLGVDELGRIVLNQKQKPASLQPYWTFSDDNSSIIQKNISTKRDLFGIPNVVEVIKSDKLGFERAIVENNNANSPISTVARGRKITKRVVNPKTMKSLDDYAKDTLRELSTYEYNVQFTHGYCGSKIGDCVAIDYRAAGFVNVKSRIEKQTISLTSGCQVSETVVVTVDLLGG